MISCTRRLEFDAGHRVMNHESKCATLHGHRYVVEIEAIADNLDAIGRIIDFSVLKTRLGEWIDREWDHTMLIYNKDFKTIENLNNCPGYKPIWISPFNPTAENMADYLLNHVCPVLFKDDFITVRKVTVWETPNCKAQAQLI